MKAADRILVHLLNGPDSASGCGAVAWDQRTGRITATQGGGDYAAQMLLGRLKKAGRVRHAPSEGSSLWELTPEGRKRAYALKERG